ncbi:SMC-Scp complex subunit ScpB [Flavisolibacter ginsenosidimutans]|uniref:SMC-Scp complex subunit ScpB n=1 Tax=Flavisolibacter ginsenosidimutans TaxID=661481 RepID=A0A5B8UNV1_9BACT|nr:SMC-Scp complex subunit ScpB [Flavisolibacter ginsenosidimutans]QEC58253.1 SMC-Scp complex subunit ScpB [Flavisolibacter ginsenosidimutans]
MDISELIPHIESLIFASDKPLVSTEITELINNAFGFMEEKIEVEQVDAALEGIVEKYNSEFYPFEVRQSGGGWQFLTKKEYHKTVAQLNGEKFLKRLSSAALETLAIIAYKQPVTKGEIESIRGVSSDYAVQKLLEKELVIITGRNEKLPGHPLVYATSKSFMDYFGINTADDLPKIKEVLADQLVQPTVVNHTDFEQSEILAVADNGELISADELGDDEETHVNGHAVEAMTASMNEEEINSDETPGDNAPTESLEDEIAEEEYITDEIFAAEDEAVEEEKVEEELSTDDVPNEEATQDEQNDSASDENESATDKEKQEE